MEIETVCNISDYSQQCVSDSESKVWYCKEQYIIV